MAANASVNQPDTHLQISLVDSFAFVSAPFPCLLLIQLVLLKSLACFYFPPQLLRLVAMAQERLSGSALHAMIASTKQPDSWTMMRHAA